VQYSALLKVKMREFSRVNNRGGQFGAGVRGRFSGYAGLEPTTKKRGTPGVKAASGTYVKLGNNGTIALVADKP
jgi:hypothetical protein